MSWGMAKEVTQAKWPGLDSSTRRAVAVVVIVKLLSPISKAPCIPCVQAYVRGGGIGGDSRISGWSVVARE